MAKFAGYGFNKSHAAAYSMVAYHTGWLKCHHPAAFIAATLSSEMANTDKVQFFSDDEVLWKDIATALDAIKLRGPGDPVFAPKTESVSDRAMATEFVFPKVVMASVIL